MNTPSSTSSPGNMKMGMTPYLHFGNSDPLLFNAWRPSSSGAMAGACIGLILFCIMERCLAAFRRAREVRWRAQSSLMSSSMHSVADKGDSTSPRDALLPTRRETRTVPPFSLSHDILRGVLHALQSTFAYALMLVVMTFNGAYIISVIVGLGIGEMLVGRVGRGKEEI